MKKARTLGILLVVMWAPIGWANDDDGPTEAPRAPSAQSPTVAMREPSGKPIRAAELFQASNKTEVFVTKKNMRVELAPYSVVELNSDGQVKVLRGSALFDSRYEESVKTTSAVVDLVGKALLSYDHKDRTTSAFVLEGEARMSNPNGKDKSLRLEKFRGASLEIHSVMPQMIRQLDIAALDGWLAGYSWPKEKRTKFLTDLPTQLSVEDVPIKEHLAEVKLEDYFSSIETADEFNQPDYYRKKFADPDQVVAEANAKKADASRPLSPEEAALISLPSTKIDIDMEVLGVAQKQKELLRSAEEKQPNRTIASVTKPRAAKKAAEKKDNGLDPEVNAVLERLRAVKERSPVISENPRPASSRGPASVGLDAVPDPVYDYSQNF